MNSRSLHFDIAQGETKNSLGLQEQGEKKDKDIYDQKHHYRKDRLCVRL